MNRLVAVCALSILVTACEGRSPLAPTGGATTTPPDGMVTYTLSGRVTDAMNVPVAGAEVRAMSEVPCPEVPEGPVEAPACTLDQMIASALTASDGTFTIVNLPSGYFRLEVSKDGALVTEGVSVYSDATLSLILQ